MSEENRNANVPHVQEGERVVLFDGVCRLCNFWVRFLLRFDTQQRFKMAPVQSEAGQEILSFFGMPLDEFETMLLVEGDKAFTKSDAVLRILKQLPFPWPVLTCFRLIPEVWRDWVYDGVARNRYRWFGKYNSCQVPDPADRKRFLNGK